MMQIEAIRAAIELLGADETRAVLSRAERAWNERVTRGATGGMIASEYVEAAVLNAAHEYRAASERAR